jgi:hypothetical protein
MNQQYFVEDSISQWQRLCCQNSISVSEKCISTQALSGDIAVA